MIIFVLMMFKESYAETKDVSNQSLGIEIGTETYYYRYEEPDVMEQDGIMYGFYGSWTHYFDWMYSYEQKYKLKLEGRIGFGQVDYTSSSTGSMNDIDDYVLELRGLAGVEYPVSKISNILFPEIEDSIITPYFGLGYRYLNDDSSSKSTTTGHLGYERESNYFYTPIGLETITYLNNGASVGLNLEFDLFWKGIQKSHISDANANFNDVENDQEKGYGFRASVEYQKKIKMTDLSAELFIRYWNIKKSQDTNVTYSGVIVGYGYEPKNNTIEFGARFGVKF